MNSERRTRNRTTKPNHALQRTGVAELGVVRRSAIVIARTKPMKTLNTRVIELTSHPLPRLLPVCSEWRACPPSHASRATSVARVARVAPLPRGSATTPARATFSPAVLRPLSTGRRFWSLVASMPSSGASFLSRVIPSSPASPRVPRFSCHVSPASERTPNHALQRTGVAVTLAAIPGSTRLVRPPSFPSSTSPLRLTSQPSRQPRPSLSLGSLGDFAA